MDLPGVFIILVAQSRSRLSMPREFRRITSSYAIIKRKKERREGEKREEGEKGNKEEREREREREVRAMFSEKIHPSLPSRRPRPRRVDVYFFSIPPSLPPILPLPLPPPRRRRPCILAWMAYAGACKFRNENSGRK